MMKSRIRTMGARDGTVDQQRKVQEETTYLYSQTMSRSLPVSETQMKSSRTEGLHSSQSQSGRSSIMTYKHTQYPSASAALSDYISDYEHQQSSQTDHAYRRTVNDLLLPRTTLQRTVERSLDTGVRDTKNEFHRFNIRKLINDSYEQILRADLEQGDAYTSSALASSREYPEMSRPRPFKEASVGEREFSDLASEISSSTDALVVANPYVVPTSHTGNKVSHLTNSKRSNPVRSVNHGREINLSRHTLKTRTPTSHSRSLPGEKRKQTPTKAYTSLPYPPRHRVTPRHSGSGQWGDTGSRKKLVASKKDGRPIPAWVTDLDSTVDSQNRLATLYQDILLNADGHAPAPQTSLAENQDAHHSMNSSIGQRQRHRVNLNPSKDPAEELSLSILSGIRPPPTWIEDLDTTTSTLPASLRLLVRDMDPDVSMTDVSTPFQGEPTQRSSRSGLSDPHSYELSKPASLHSEILRPKVSLQNRHSMKRPQNVAREARNARPRSENQTHHLGQREKGNHMYHKRTQSASTEDLINESPYGDGTSKLKTSVQPSFQYGSHQSRNPGGALHSTGRERRHPSTKESKQNGMTSFKCSQPNKNVQPQPPHTTPGYHHRHAATKAHNPPDTSTTTDSLIYSSPFGLDRDLALSDPLQLPRTEDRGGPPTRLSPVHSQASDDTLKEEELYSLSTFSSLMLQDDHLGDGEKTSVPIIGDHISETTVGETARANAMLRRANRAIENTHASLNTSSLLEQQDSSLDSAATEELLAGDQDIMSKLRAEIRSKDAASRDPEVQAMMDQFLDDCLHSSGQKSPRTHRLPGSQVSEGPLESLKNMLFKLQDMASQHTLQTGDSTVKEQPMGYSSEYRTGNGRGKLLTNTNSQSQQRQTSQPEQSSDLSRPPSGSAARISAAHHHPEGNISLRSQRNFEEEPGGKSLQRAMKHLSRLKTLVAMDTASS